MSNEKTKQLEQRLAVANRLLEEALRELGKLIAADHAQPKAVACGRLLGGRFTKSTNKNKKHNALK